MKRLIKSLFGGRGYRVATTTPPSHEDIEAHLADVSQREVDQWKGHRVKTEKLARERCLTLADAMRLDMGLPVREDRDK